MHNKSCLTNQSDSMSKSVSGQISVQIQIGGGLSKTFPTPQ